LKLELFFHPKIKVNVIFPHLNLSIDPLMAPPSNEQAKLLRQLVLSGMVDKIAKCVKFNAKKIKLS